MQHTHTPKCKEWATAKNIVSFLNIRVSFQYTTPQNPPNFPFLHRKSGFGTEIALKGTKTKIRSNLEQSSSTMNFNKGAAQKRISKMIKPLADRIVVKPAEAEQKTSSGLFIPDNAKEKPMQGKVVAVGPGRKNDKGEVVAMEVKVGDVVLYGKYSGTEVTVDGENFLIVKESDVIATL